MINLGEGLNAPETPVHRVEQILTLGSREVATSRSRLDFVEAFIDSIVDCVNQHEQEIPEPQREKIVHILDKQLVDTCDAHL